MNKIRNEIVSPIEERDLKDVQNMLANIFDNHTEYEKIRQYYKESEDNKNVHLYGYYIDDKLVGMIMLDIAVLPAGKKTTVWNFAVLEEHRKQGIATKLMNKIEEVVKAEKDIKKIWLFSGIQRKPAHELYRKLGYEEDGYKAFYKII